MAAAGVYQVAEVAAEVCWVAAVAATGKALEVVAKAEILAAKAAMVRTSPNTDWRDLRTYQEDGKVQMGGDCDMLTMVRGIICHRSGMHHSNTIRSP